MKHDQDGYDLHILVCTNEKAGGLGCGGKGGQVIVDQLKAWSRSGALQGGKVRINKSGCLGRCDEAIACVAYPKGEWVVEATPQDLPEIQAWISGLLKSS
jgi:(2Fe-2S) ferredoxin